jgi:lambda family phage portal protein
MLSSEHLPLAKNETLPNGNEIIFGIELDRIGRRVAYHFHRTHPGDVRQQGVGELVRVPAEQVCHVFHPVAEGQIRGVPWVAPAMVRLWLLDQYDDAELDRKKVAAMFAGFVTRPGPDDVMGEDSAQKDQDGAALIGLQPGTMQLLLPGEDIKFSDPADVGGSYEAFQYRTLLACCSAMGVPYTNVTGDLRQANYSSLREGKLEFRRRIEQFQHGTLIYQLCRPVWQRWLRDAVLAGALELPDFAQNPAPYFAVKWIPPKWDWVDPLKDRKAEIEAIDAGLKSRSDVIESEGYDAEEVDRRIAADHAREQELGLSFGRTSEGRDLAAEDEPEREERDPEKAPATTEENAA